MADVPLAEKIKSNPRDRGLAIIVTNDYTSLAQQDPESHLSPLNGTKKDGESMSAAFNHLDFVVHWEHNITSTELTQLIHEATNFEGYRSLKRYKCIVFIFSGHGDLGDFIYLQDGSKLSIGEQIIDPFLPKSSPNMGHLQKLFFIDACRGKEEMKTVMVTRSGSSKGKCDLTETCGAIEKIRVPAEGGFLVAFSTMPRFQAWEGIKGGAWLQMLADKIQQSRDSIEDVLTQVNKKLVKRTSNFVQQPEKLSRLNDVIYLHPDRDTPEKKKPSIAAVFPSSSIPETDDQPQNYQSGAALQEYTYQHYWELISQYPSADFCDYSHIPPELKVTYYYSTVTVSAPNSVQPIIGDSGKYFFSVELARDEAAKDILQKLATATTDSAYPEQHLGSSVVNSQQQVATPESPDQPYTQPESVSSTGNYFQQLNTLFQKNSVRSQFSYPKKHIGGQMQYRCIVQYELNGEQKEIDTEQFYPSKSDAKQQAAKLILSKENATVKVIFKGAVGTTPPNKVWKSRLKEYCDRNTTDPRLKPNYTTTPSGNGSGFVSTVAFLHRTQSGEVCKSKTEAEHNAALLALQSIEIEQ